MQILLSSAKLMNTKVEKILKTSTPLFLNIAENIIENINQYSICELEKLLHCNHSIAAQNWQRFQKFFDLDIKKYPSIFLYNGQVFKHLNPNTFDQEDLLFAQNHLWITSFLYGLLKPLDKIQPYRMDGNITLNSDKIKKQKIFHLWKPILTQFLIEQTQQDDNILIHLSTSEYQNLFNWKEITTNLNVIQPRFLVHQNGKLKNITVYAKACRGAMSKYIITNKIDKIEDLYNFNYEGFSYSSKNSNTNSPLFILNI